MAPPTTVSEWVTGATGKLITHSFWWRTARWPKLPMVSRAPLQTDMAVCHGHIHGIPHKCQYSSHQCVLLLMEVLNVPRQLLRLTFLFRKVRTETIFVLFCSHSINTCERWPYVNIHLYYCVISFGSLKYLVWIQYLNLGNCRDRICCR